MRARGDGISEFISSANSSTVKEAGAEPEKTSSKGLTSSAVVVSSSDTPTDPSSNSRRFIPRERALR